MPHPYAPTPLPESRLRLWRKLRMAKYRKKTGLFVAEGLRGVEQLVRQLAAGGRVGMEALVLEEGFEAGPEGVRLASMAAGVGAAVHVASTAGIAQLADTSTPQPVLAVCRIPEPLGEEELPGLGGRGQEGLGAVVLALDALQDPGNLGAILRAAAWFGAAAVVCGEGTVDAWSPKCVRSTAGAVGSVPMVKTGDLAALARRMRERGWRVASLELGPDAAPIGRLRQDKDAEGLMLVIGNEANGVSERVRDAAGERVVIPGRAEAVESLNASVAASIALYEVLGRSRE